MCFGLVVTCMPSVRLLLLHVFPQLHSATYRARVLPGRSRIGNNGSRQYGRQTTPKNKDIEAKETDLILENNSAHELLRSNSILLISLDSEPLNL